MTSTEKQNRSSMFPTLLHVRDDAGVSPASSDSGYDLGAIVESGRTVHVGDVVRFSCRGIAPRDRDLMWWLQPHGAQATARVTGDEVDLDWTVTSDSVGPATSVGINMAADTKFHREGGPGDSGRDAWVQYVFTVRP